MKTPLISVIIVTYKAVDYLESAIKSVIGQKYAKVELIIIDGGSTDGTVDVIQKYEDRISQWISEPDSGIYDAMNKGIKLAKGDWVFFLGSDDILVNILHKIALLLKKPNYVYYGNVYMPNKNIFYDGVFTASKLVSKNISHQAIFYPRLVFDKYCYSLNYPRGGDWELNFKVWGDRTFKFIYLPYLIAIFNDDKIVRDDWAQNWDWAFENDRALLAQKYLAHELGKKKFVDRFVGLLLPVKRLMFPTNR
jgi:glycosyltransferase involved in cell wall biosynthesis